eukprot:TRINITY_DN4323_c0_g1_i1.p1 TRINITY_DN4323_c0_g1~~TRINITY_DN4323_c0_g1_i1.p1  ORF type:complete len:224 (-),score=84.12 TRINITY_DN4323_c0_g1_i1:315-908(-)
MVMASVKALIEHTEGEERNKYLEEMKQQILDYLKLEIEYTTGRAVIERLKKHLETKEGTMDTDMVAEYKKLYDEEMENNADKVKVETLKKHQRYLEMEQLIASKLGAQGGLGDMDDDLVCGEEETTYVDPWSKKKIEIPVRNKACNHLYDKSTAMKMLSRAKGKVKCPVVGCANNNLKSSDLVEDNQVRKIIESQRD